jgi:NADH-quinone oxidoreductase subunit J
MLFLFVLMLVGVDIRNRWSRRSRRSAPWPCCRAGFWCLLVLAIGNAIVGPTIGLRADNAENGGNVQGIAALIFNRYVFAFEATSALLITAASGHGARPPRAADQASYPGDLAGTDEALRRDRPASGSAAHSGVFARHNAVDTPALLPTEASRSFGLGTLKPAAPLRTAETWSSQSITQSTPLPTSKLRAQLRKKHDEDASRERR